MKNKRMMGLFLALLLFLIQASALAEPEIIINPDGTRTTVYRDNSGVIVSKYYHDADMQLYRTENFDHTGELSNYATITFTADGARQMDNYEADGTLTGRTLFFQDGTARRIEFTLALARVDDDDVDQLGDLELEEELHIDP